jgi:hypothetical protein
MTSREYSFQKMTQFLQGNNVLNAAASNLDPFLWRDTCVSPTQLNSTFWNNMSLVPPSHHDYHEVLLSTFKSIPNIKQRAR